MLDFIEEKPIKFYNGDESSVVIETEDPHESIFKSQYERALDIISGFWSDKDQEELSSPNIVAFCGDRG